MEKSRRLFIKNASLGLLSVTAFNPFKGLKLSSQKKNALPNWRDLVEVARWCPTVHNLQPHLVKVISDTEAELYYNPERLLPVGDPNSIFSTVAMGIFVEHLSIASAPYGYSVRFSKVYEPISTLATGPTLFAKLELVPRTQKETLAVDLIKKRRTSRMEYDGKALESSSIQLLKTQAEAHQQEFHHSSDPKFIEMMVDLNQHTLFEDLESKPNREELDNLFRYEKEDAEVKKDGLWAKCMGFRGKLMKSVFQKHEKWTKGLRRRMLRKTYRSSFDGTSSICWISGKFQTPADWLEAGKFFARNWLLLTQEGAYLQPLGSLITNTGAYKTLQSELPSPKQGNELWLLYRAGYSDEPTRSYRLDTNDLLIQ